MVVGGQQDIESGILDCQKELIRSTEGRIPSIGLPAHGYFQVANGYIRLTDFPMYMLKAVRIIVPVLSTGCFYLGIVLHQVTNKQ
jgi:hypothetical protein